MIYSSFSSVGVSAIITVITDMKTIVGARFPRDFKMNAGIMMRCRRVVNNGVVYHLNVTVHKSFHGEVTIAIVGVLRRFLLPFSFVAAATAAALKSTSFLSGAV